MWLVVIPQAFALFPADSGFQCRPVVSLLPSAPVVAVLTLAVDVCVVVPEVARSGDRSAVSGVVVTANTAGFNQDRFASDARLSFVPGTDVFIHRRLRARQVPFKLTIGVELFFVLPSLQLRCLLPLNLPLPLLPAHWICARLLPHAPREEFGSAD